MASLIQVKKHAPSGSIILNRPAKRNALSGETLRQVLQAFGDFHLERSVRAVIITGAGAAFCAGADLLELQESSRRDDAQRKWHEDAVQFKELMECMLRFPKPIIAAVNGPAAGDGAGLILASDLVVGCVGATFGFPEARRGLVAGIVSPLLAFRIGGGPAARLLLTAESIEAEEAHRLHIYHEMVGPEQVWARAHELANLCARSAPEALQLTKRMLNETIGEHLETTLAAGAAASATSRTTEAAIEGTSAFLEKRPPQWP
jgi:methylglutaconyl-CoA hydratase